MMEVFSEKGVNDRFGGLFLVLGAIVSCLVFADRWTTLDIDFPSIWYRSRNFHLLICVALFVAAWCALRNNSGDSESDPAAEPIFESLVVYTKSSCELCERAIDVLEEFADVLPFIKVVSIDDDSELQSQFGESIPVVLIDGRVRFHGIVSRELLKRLIHARQQQRMQPVTEAASLEGHRE